jgi:pimeloyl-ACP methyl ester carboxylesterase
MTTASEFKERVAALQADFFADDLEPPDDACRWSQDELTAFYESGGTYRPRLSVPVQDGGAAEASATTEQQAVAAPPKNEEEDSTAGIVLRPAGRARFRNVQPKVFVTAKGVRLVYQLATGTKPPLVFLGGGMSGRIEACEQFAAESPQWSEHTVLIFDRRNVGASDVRFDADQPMENYAQRDDVIELLQSLGLGPYILIGFSSGARLFALVAMQRPELVRGLALLILTGGPAAAANLGAAYYMQYAEAARGGGMHAVLQTPHYAERAALNNRSREALLGMDVSTFVKCMEASAELYRQTQHEPALGLPAASLRDLGALHKLPCFVSNFFPPVRNDGMHTPEVSKAVAACIGDKHAKLVVSEDTRVWFGGLVGFVAGVP